MSHKSIESCAFKLTSWRPFDNIPNSPDSSHTPKPHTPKRPCFADRVTSFTLDMSKLCLLDDETTISATSRTNFKLIARKRRRRGSRSASGRSCSVGANATCSDFNVAVGTDSSGELFVSGDANWGSDVGEVKTSSGKDDKESSGVGGVGTNGMGMNGGGVLVDGMMMMMGNESGYGSEPGYRGDAEFGYGDEVDEEEDDQRMLFWGDRNIAAAADTDTSMEIVGENSFSDQKVHHRFRRKKHDWRMGDAMS